MSLAANDDFRHAGPHDIEARLVYAVDTGEKLINQTMEPGNMDRKVTGTYQDHAVHIRDGRPLRDSFDLDVHGFVFVDHPTAVPDFYVPENVSGIYYPEAEKLLRETTGAKRVHIFDHTLRHGNEADRKVRAHAFVLPDSPRRVCLFGTHARFHRDPPSPPRMMQTHSLSLRAWRRSS